MPELVKPIQAARIIACQDRKSTPRKDERRAKEMVLRPPPAVITRYSLSSENQFQRELDVEMLFGVVDVVKQSAARHLHCCVVARDVMRSAGYE